jgi:hypothetical protein
MNGMHDEKVTAICSREAEVRPFLPKQSQIDAEAAMYGIRRLVYCLKFCGAITLIIMLLPVWLLCSIYAATAEEKGLNDLSH